MPKNLKPIAQTDFSGGMNLVVNPYLVSQKQAVDLENLILSEHGSAKTRDGVSTLTTSPLLTPIHYRGVLVKVAGTIKPFAVQENVGSTANRLYQTDSVPWTQVAGDFTTLEPLPDSVVITDNAIILNGYETPISYDGTTWTRITAGGLQTVPPGAKHGAFHLGSLWLWNTNATTTSLDGPSSLRMSDPSNPNSWPNANQTFVSKDDGQVGMGMSSFTIVETGISPTATLVLFKNYSGYQVTGVFGGATFGVQRIKSDMGSIAPRTIQFVSGFGIIRLTHKGFALYNGVEDRLISEEVRPAIFGGGSFSALDFTNINRSWASQSQNPPLYIAACPISGAGLNRVFIYDLIRRGWTIVTLPTSISTLNLFLTTAAFPTVHAGTFVGGQIQELFNGSATDDGVNIAWSMLTRAFFVQNPLTTAFFRRANVLVVGTRGQTFTATPIIDGVSRPPQIFTFPALKGGVTYDTDAPNTVETGFSVNISETAHTCQLKLAGSGHIHVRSIEVQASQKPLTIYVDRG